MVSKGKQITLKSSTKRTAATAAILIVVDFVYVQLCRNSTESVVKHGDSKTRMWKLCWFATKSKINVVQLAKICERRKCTGCWHIFCDTCIKIYPRFFYRGTSTALHTGFLNGEFLPWLTNSDIEVLRGYSVYTTGTLSLSLKLLREKRQRYY